PLLAQRHPFLDQRHRQPRGTAVEGGPGDGQLAVPVGVRLDDGAQPRRVGHATEQGDVVPDGVDVDLGPRRPPALTHHEPASGRRLSESTRETRSGRSPATRPSSGPRAAARPWTCAASAAASVGGTPRARKAPIMPERTSPVPAVANLGPPLTPKRTRPAGSATAVVDPFTRATPREAAANRRAALARSGPGGSPIRRRYSPSWGVRIVVGVDGVVEPFPVWVVAGASPSLSGASPSRPRA